ncbi:DNA-3-methyladenine glycosylase [Leptolyngbya ohadii]|uniref:DNA-3-methyladenine glycosylase n=1 Tax=Leptolyngbya ohadii TaxID=1962290 RepID=UPI0021F1DE45|nr:DNA-3-methyladenine glycosylase [Leptolyngbya ohadii]
MSSAFFPSSDLPTPNENLPIAPEWLSRPAPEVATDLLGCVLVRQFPDGQTYRGLIVETEAYTPDDPAMHAYRRETDRNRILFGKAGMSYVYRIYGIYHCFNVVTDLEGRPSAVLLRALELDRLPDWTPPTDAAKPHRAAAGPGKLCRILQIDTSLTAQPLAIGNALWLEHRSIKWQAEYDHHQIEFVQTTRIGLTQGVDLPWRWYVKSSKAVSRR